MSGRLAGKVTVITGATAGIGLGTAKRFVKEGATVIFNARRPEAGARVEALLRGLAAGGEVHYVQADISVQTQTEAVVDRALQFGRLDALVNNAQAFVPTGPITTAPDKHYRHALEGGLFATKWAMQRAFPTMRDQGGGSIVNMSTGWNWLAPPNLASYGANKAAIESLTRTAASEWGRYNINVNIVMPYSKSKGYERYAADNPEAAKLSAAENPLKRVGDPEADLGSLILGLVTEEARFITGQTFDGGGGHIHLRRAHQSTEDWVSQ